MNLPRQLSDIRFKEVVNVFLCVIIGTAFAGFFVGISESHAPVSQIVIHDIKQMENSEEVLPAVSYREMNARERSVNRNWQVNISTLKNRAPSVLEPVPTPRMEDRIASLELRNSRRAYDGALPVIPHAIDQRSAVTCLTCHGEGVVFGTVTAPKMSHQYYTNCTQCHVEMDNPQLTLGREMENTFEGRMPPTHGKRAWFGAPPVIPHHTQMRTDCNSCHGPTGLPGLRTTHPERQNCMQCHAPSAEMDQQPLLPPRLVMGSEED